MKEYIDIYKSIQERFQEKTGQKIQEGTVVDLFTVSLSETMEDIYREIEENKNPHLYSGLTGVNLDDMGYFLNLPREASEEDPNYLYRMMRWTYGAEAGNTKAIEDVLLNMEYSSAVDYIPMTSGSGTATAFIIPKDYSEETVEAAIREVKEKIKKKASPSLYIDYVVPKIVPVEVRVYFKTIAADAAQIQGNITQRFRDYINSIPPREKLNVGVLNKIGIEEPQMEYFHVTQIFINKKELQETEVVQNIETKFILDDIIWN